MVDLSGLHLLVTRPSEQADSWSPQLLELGAEVSRLPMMIIEPLQQASEQQAIIDHVLEIDKCQKLIFISQNAVRMAIPWIDQYWPQLPIGLEYFAVGKATANLLSQSLGQLGEMVTAPMQAMNSEDLLGLPALQSVSGEKVLIFKGQGGRTHLAESLIARGAAVDYCELYRRDVPQSVDREILTQFIQSAKTPIVVVHSGETLDNLCHLMSPDDLNCLQRQVILVPGQRVAEMAATKGFQQIIVALNATHDSMVKALYDWKNNGIIH